MIIISVTYNRENPYRILEVSEKTEFKGVNDCINYFLLICIELYHICICIFWSFRARQHLTSLAPVMNKYGWLWWPDDIREPCGPKAPWHLSYRWGKPPKKTHPGNLSWPGIELGPAAWQARILPSVPQRWTCIV